MQTQNSGFLRPFLAFLVIFGLIVASVVWLVMPLVHSTQCATVKGDWRANSLVSGAHVVTTVDGQAYNDYYTNPQPPTPAMQAKAKAAEAQYTQMGCISELGQINQVNVNGL